MAWLPNSRVSFSELKWEHYTLLCPHERTVCVRAHMPCRVKGESMLDYNTGLFRFQLNCLHGIPLSACKFIQILYLLPFSAKGVLFTDISSIRKPYKNSCYSYLYKGKSVIPCGWNLRIWQMKHLQCWSSYPKTKWLKAVEQGLLKTRAFEKCHCEACEIISQLETVISITDNI